MFSFNMRNNFSVVQICLINRERNGSLFTDWKANSWSRDTHTMISHGVWGFWDLQQLEDDCRPWLPYLGMGRMEGSVEQRFWNKLRNTRSPPGCAPHPALPAQDPTWTPAGSPSQRMGIVPGCSQGKTLPGTRYVWRRLLWGWSNMWRDPLPGVFVVTAGGRKSSRFSSGKGNIRRPQELGKPDRNSWGLLVPLNTWHGNWKTWFGKDKTLSVSGNQHLRSLRERGAPAEGDQEVPSRLRVMVQMCPAELNICSGFPCDPSSPHSVPPALQGMVGHPHPPNQQNNSKERGDECRSQLCLSISPRWGTSERSMSSSTTVKVLQATLSFRVN